MYIYVTRLKKKVDIRDEGSDRNAAEFYSKLTRNISVNFSD